MWMLKIENTSEYNKTTDWQVSKNLIEQRGIYNEVPIHRTQKIEAITEKTWYSESMSEVKTHYARAFDYRGVEYSKKPFKFSNTEAGFVTFKAWVLRSKKSMGRIR